MTPQDGDTHPVRACVLFHTTLQRDRGDRLNVVSIESHRGVVLAGFFFVYFRPPTSRGRRRRFNSCYSRKCKQARASSAMGRLGLRLILQPRTRLSRARKAKKAHQCACRIRRATSFGVALGKTIAAASTASSHCKNTKNKLVSLFYFSYTLGTCLLYTSPSPRD